MKLLSSLKNRVFVATALLAVLPIGMALHFVSLRVTREGEEQLRRGLIEASNLVERQHSARAEALADMARLVADLPKLKAAVATADGPTVEPVAQDYRNLVKADVVVITDHTPRVLVALGASPEAVVPESLGAVLRGQEARAFRVENGRLLEVFTVRITIGLDSPEVMGTLSLGFALDDALAAHFKGLTGSDVIFTLDGQIHASTLASNPDLQGVLSGGGMTLVDVAGSEYVAQPRPLGAPGAPTAVILHSRTESLRFLRTLRAALALAALSGVAVAVLLSYAVARTVTRPLAAITAAMREIAATGDLTRKISLARAWDDEDARLLARTFNILTDSIARFQREAALRERLSALGRLSTVIAHEVRNPLMIIKGSLRGLRQEGLSAHERRETADDIDHEVARLDRIVGDVLDFARPLRVDRAPTDLNALCTEVVESTLGNNGLRVGLSLDPTLPLVTTDGERLRTVLVNVLVNAKESLPATPPAENGDVPPVELRTVGTLPNRAAIVVADRGTGISPQHLPHVFEPYFTTKRTGTGLGLAIAKNIVDALGGAISAEGRPGQGTVIRIELPLEEPAARG